jgi:hypothetical protein
MNIMTEAMERLTKMLEATDERLKQYGVEPYGMREATPSEERARFENLTTHELARLVREQGKDKVNKWLGKHMKEGY